MNNIERIGESILAMLPVDLTRWFRIECLGPPFGSGFRNFFPRSFPPFLVAFFSRQDLDRYEIPLLMQRTVIPRNVEILWIAIRMMGLRDVPRMTNCDANGFF